MPLKILLVDDHQIVRQGFRSLLEREGFAVVAEGADGREAVRLAHLHNPDIAVLDVCMPDMNGLEAACAIVQADPRMKVILLTVHAEEYQIVAALRAGVKGYVLKTQAAAELVDGIRQVAAGGIYLSPTISHWIVNAYLAGTEPPVEPLTSRERHVLQLVAEGKSTKEVASDLRVTVKTVETYRSRIMEKLGIHGVAGLVRYAIRHGIIELTVAACFIVDRDLLDLNGLVNSGLDFLVAYFV
jgi:DNA-binding NarL/FixJ family response regulator